MPRKPKQNPSAPTNDSRRVIRDWRTGLFFAHGQWIIDRSLAQQFPTQDAVEQCIAAHQILDAEMVWLEGPRNSVVGGVMIPWPSTFKFTTTRGDFLIWVSQSA
jgi:hypothetical protein